MEFLTELWLPILVSGVALWFASFIAWAVLPHHNGDWKKAPDQKKAIDALRALDMPEGRYVVPCGRTKEEREAPEVKDAWENGPRGTINLWPKVNMGMNMAKTFAYFLVTSVFTAYIAWYAFGGTSPVYLDVFRMVGATGVLVYSLGGIPNAIWFRWPIIGNIFDGIAYALVSAGVFGWLWPT